MGEGTAEQQMGGHGFDHGSGEANGNISRAASAWLIQLEDDPDDAELRAAFDTWLAADALHPVAWEETMRVARVIAAGTANKADSSVIRMSAFRRRVRGISSHWRGLSVAAAAACLAWVTAPEIMMRLRADHVAETGHVSTIRLADGSNVFLAPGSAISTDMAGQERHIQLLRGDAFFDVAHDTQRPFRVTAGASETTVLGTAFEVQLKDEGAAVSVRRGRVRVAYSSGGSSRNDQLSVGQKLELQWDGQSVRENLDPRRVATWLEGHMVVNDRPVSDVINAIRPWYKGYIMAVGKGLHTRRVTGLYDLRNPDAALQALTKAHDITVRDVSPWLRIVTIS